MDFLVKTVNDSGIAIFQAVAAGGGEGGNVLVSPTGLNFVLSSACAGAESATRDQLRELLRHELLGSDANDRKIHAMYKPLVTALQNTDPTVDIHMANAIWVDPAAVRSQGDNLDAFGRHTADVFGTELLRRYGKGGQVMNDWASEVTHEQINRVSADDDDEAAPSAPLLLTAVAAMKARWTSAFDPFHTWPGEFTSEHGQGMLCHFMFQKGTFECAHLQDFTAVRLPCGISGDISVSIIVPNFAKIDEAVTQFTPERWQAVCRSFVKEDIKLYVPRFRVESTTSLLKHDLEKLGIADAFCSDKSDMSRLGEAGTFWVEDVLHSTAFVMAEDGASPIAGVEDGAFELACAASVTDIRIDRPFLFVVHMGEAMIFLGKIVAPMALD